MSKPKHLVALAAFALAALIMSAIVNPSTADAQTQGSVELIAQSAWVEDGGIYSIQVRAVGASPESTIVLRVLSPWVERDDFLNQELPEDTTVLLELEPVLLSEAQGTSNEVLNLEVLLDGPATRLDNTFVEGSADDRDQIPPVLVSEGGSVIYPVEVALFDRNGRLADSFLTSLIELPRRDLRPPLDVATVIEPEVELLSTPTEPAQLTDATLNELAVLTNSLSQHPTSNVALSISPLTLATLDEDESEVSERILERLRSTLSSSQLLPNPVTDVEEQAWLDAELVDQLGAVSYTHLTLPTTPYV